MLVSGIQQTDSVLYIYLLFQICFPFRLLYNIEQGSLCYTVGPWWLYIVLNWRIVVLQYCVSFCCTTKWIRYMYTYAPLATHSSTLAWKIPWPEEPGGLQSMGLLRVRHDWATSLSLFTIMHWRKKWQPTPVFLPGESQGWGSLLGCRLWGNTESDTTEAT